MFTAARLQVWAGWFGVHVVVPAVPPVMSPAVPPLGVPAEPPDGVPALPPEGVPAEPAVPPVMVLPPLALEPPDPPSSPSSAPPDAPPQLETAKTRSAEIPKPTVPKDLTFAIAGEPYAEERGLSRTPASRNPRGK
jgi:hypothetical protein